jgi:hypothetical protein
MRERQSFREQKKIEENPSEEGVRREVVESERGLFYWLTVDP